MISGKKLLWWFPRILRSTERLNPATAEQIISLFAWTKKWTHRNLRKWLFPVQCKVKRLAFCYLQLFMQCWDNKKLSIAPHLDNVKYCLTWQTCSINRVLMQTWAQKSLNTIFLNILTAFYSLSAFLFFNTGFFRVGVNLVCFTNIYFVQLVPHNVYWAWC